MNDHLIALSALSASLHGKRLECAFLSLYVRCEDFLGCQAFIAFEDRTLLELSMVHVEDRISYPVEVLPKGCQRVDTVDGIPINGMTCAGLCISEGVFSIGIIIPGTTNRILCLDTMAGIRMQLYLHPLSPLVENGAVLFVNGIRS